ncbi:MAG: glycosyltransferase [Tepidisphaerales bacterium]
MTTPSPSGSAVDHSGPAAYDARPALAIVADAPTPYRLAFHVRLARELAPLRLVSYFTHPESNAPWALNLPPEIGPVRLCEQRDTHEAGFRNQIHQFRRAGRILRDFKAAPPAAVIINGYNDLGRLRVLSWCKRHRIPAFIWGDSNLFSDRTGGIKRLLKQAVVRYAVHRSEGVMVCGRLGHAFFQHYAGRSVPTFIVPYEPDYTLFASPPPERRTHIAARYGLTMPRRRLIYSGRLAPEKRVDLLIDAFHRIAARRPQWDLLLVGDGPLRSALEQRVRPDLAERVRFLGFQNDAADVAAIYHHGDALCLPSEFEPWAVVISEAAAAGLALVASHVVGAAPELVHDGINGRTFFSNDLDDLTDALLDVTHPDRIDRYRAASPRVLEGWHQRCDPVLGVRKALASVGRAEPAHAATAAPAPSASP